ncbi:MAG: triose-phosphate isomerase [Candidatus Uhrbacteria bacterium]|nr:triose-phosphate isomerase [Patescibacteria group bacterium]MBU1906991.1 triose-phosphate isomerase [Patescibacteria group bacterium]
MKTVIANWKMNVNVRESVALARGVTRGIRGKDKLPEIVLCASAVALSEMKKILTRSRISLGAQNVHWAESGAHTGETSTRQLAEAKVSHVIVGHSERRTEMGETDVMVNQKIKALLAAKMVPVLCVGETAEVKKKNAEAAKKYVRDQLSAALDGVRFDRQKPFYIAYEPIWSISTSFVKQAKPEEIVEMHEVIRTWLDQQYGHDATAEVHILYGGSVNKENVYSFLREPAIEGVLVGGASVRLNEFMGIIKTAIEINGE